MNKSRRFFHATVLSAALLAASTASACNPAAREARDLQAACTSGDAAACNTLGWQVYRGAHVLRDWRRAAELFQAACDGGEGEGCVRLARLHTDAGAPQHGVPLDSAAAVRLLLEGCEIGAMAGCTGLGDMYAASDSLVPDVEPAGVLQDLGRARELYGRACDGGGPVGCVRLGGLYHEGTGVERDDSRAVALYRQACDAGSPLGCAHLGNAQATGMGVERDATLAASLLEEACESEMLGCFYLAGLLAEGDGVGQDLERAVDLFDKACDGTSDRGEGSPSVPQSCYRLGEMYSNGTGVDANPYFASSYFRRACRLGHQEGCRRS